MPFFTGTSGQVHYRHWPCPDGVAGLVFLPGMGQHSGHYHRFARALGAEHIETWALDHVGHGLSEGEPGNPGPVADLAANALQLTAIAEGERPGLPLAIMGHSLGAATAIAALAKQPDRFAAVVLCGLPRAAAANLGAVDGVRVPILVVHGVDDRLAPLEGARSWTAGVPAADLREYEDAGHDLLHEPVHRRVTSDVAAFIRDGIRS
ncbi:alpha/beta hydrolase [Rhodococcus sp. NPDC127528]|uniref:alpha/beta hydrolase n=1 Tax=unclassified Rhodococcus (in: high G+C Gram-positive bacteria) TaxID=192944 RepID=UPI00362F56FA